MKLIDCALGFLNGGQLDKSEALGTVRVAVADDLHILDGSNPAEELLKVAFGGVKGKVADVNARRGHLNTLRLTALAGSGTFGTVRTWGTLLLGSGLLTTESDEGEKLGEETFLLSGLMLAARAVLTTVAAL
jgi:hypothetical protein